MLCKAFSPTYSGFRPDRHPCQVHRANMAEHRADNFKRPPRKDTHAERRNAALDLQRNVRRSSLRRTDS